MRPPGVYAIETQMFDLIDRQAVPERITGGFGLTGGLVFSRLGFLLLSDVQRELILEWKAATKKKEPSKDQGTLTTFREKSGRAAGLTFDHQGRLLTCEAGSGRVTRTEKNGTISLLAESYEGKRLGSPTDLVYAIDGSIYFTDVPANNAASAEVRTNVPAVYRIARSQIPGPLRLTKESQDCTRPVGVALSPKQDLLYVADAGRRNIRVHPINDDGSLGAGRVFAEFKSDEPGVPGGLKTDELGNVYATGPGGLWMFNPTGKTLGVLVTPEPLTHCSWGAGFNSLYLLAQTSLYHIGTRVPGTRTY